MDDILKTRSSYSERNIQLHSDAINRFQDLKRFKLPPNFRGRTALTVQLWFLVQATLFRCSPQILYGFRRWIPRLCGARVGKGVVIRPSATLTYPWKIDIRDYSWKRRRRGAV